MSVQVVLPGVLADLAGGARQLNVDLSIGAADPETTGAAAPRSSGSSGTGPTGSGDAPPPPPGSPTASTLATVLDELERTYPVLVRRLRDETGALRRYVNVYVDGLDVRGAQGTATPVGEDAVVRVLPSTAGG